MNRLKEPLVIMKKELRVYFTTPIAYIVIAIFLIITGISFFKDFFYFNQAEMRNFFQLLPLIFIPIIPAITMKLFSEERHSGSLEILMTLPVTNFHAVFGKFLAASVFIILMLAPTLFYVVTLEMTGSPYYGPIIGGYIGAILLGSAYASIGVLMSSLTKNQVIAFIITFVLCAFLWLVDKFMIFLPAAFSSLEILGSDFHFRNIARGVVDSRDVLYFLSIIIISLLISVRVIDERRV